MCGCPRNCRTLLRALWPFLLGGSFHYCSGRILPPLEEDSDLNLGMVFRRRVQQYASLKHESPKYWLVFHLLPAFHKAVLCCHKHFISCVALSGRTELSGEHLVSFWVEPGTHSVWICASSFSVVWWIAVLGLLTVSEWELKLLWRFVMKCLLNYSGVTVHLAGVILMCLCT